MFIEGLLCVKCSSCPWEYSNEQDRRGPCAHRAPVLVAEPHAVTWSLGVGCIMKLLCPCVAVYSFTPCHRALEGSPLPPHWCWALCLEFPLPLICLANALLFSGFQLCLSSPRKSSLPSLLSQLPPLFASLYLSICLFCLSLKT